MSTLKSIWTRWRSVKHPIRHSLYKSVEIIGGAAFLSPPGQALWRAQLRRQSATPPIGVRSALVAHVYYPDLLEELLDCWRALPAGAPLHITTQPEKAAEVQARLSTEKNVSVHLADNRGRDIAPFLTLLGSGALDGYDAVLKLHTKRSPHLRTGDLRRRLLYSVLAGHPMQVQRALGLFADPNIGLAGWRMTLRTRPSYWMANEPRVRELMDRVSPGTPVELAFFEGSMFWVRPAALAPLRRLALTPADFEAETGQTDSALHHAIERCFGLVARAAGYETRLLSGRPVAQLQGKSRKIWATLLDIEIKA